MTKRSGSTLGVPGRGRTGKGAVFQYLISQFARPRGVMGAIAGSIMAARPSNRQRNLRTVEFMKLEPGHNVLEIGFGPGIALKHVCRLLVGGRAVGLDHSTTMQGMAARSNRAAVRSGRLTLLAGKVEDLECNPHPALAGPFDRIFAVNVAMFWDDPIAILKSLAGRLRGGGSICLTIQPRLGVTTPEPSAAVGKRIADQMRAAGLGDVRIKAIESLSPPAVCVIGARG